MVCAVEELWSKDGARAYVGSMLPGFPNFFMIYGPNTNQLSGLQIVAMEEVATRFALENIGALIEQGKQAVEVTEDAYWRYNAEIDRAERLMTYVDPRAHNYYQNEFGRSAANGPLDTRLIWNWLRDPASRRPIRSDTRYRREPGRAIPGHRSALRGGPGRLIMTGAGAKRPRRSTPSWPPCWRRYRWRQQPSRARMIPAIRETLVTPPETVIGARPIVHSDRVVPGPPGGPDLTVTVFERPDRKPGGPAICYIHGGGMIIGDRWFGTGTIIDWVDDLDAILVTVEYRLAPEHPYPARSRRLPRRPVVDGRQPGRTRFRPRQARDRRRQRRRRAGRRSCPQGPRRGRPRTSRPGAHLPHARRPQPDHLELPVRRLRPMGSRRATTPAGTPTSATGARPTRCRSTPRRPGPRTCRDLPADIHRRRQRRGLPRRRRRLRRRRCGPTEATASCTCGRADSMPSTWPPPTPNSRRP